MNEKISELSVFFPFWNEEKNIEKVVINAIPVVEKIAKNWEIIIIDDGSSDKTPEIAKKLAENNPHLKVITHKKNRGYGASLKSGFEAARYGLVIFTDGDGQFDFSQISKFLPKIKTSDIVIGYRQKRHDNPIRHVLMNLLKIWDFIFFGFVFKDIDCGFKMFRKEALEKIRPFKSEGAMITTEILAKAKKQKLKITQVEVSHYPRIYGDQSGGNLRVILRAIKESFVIWKNINYGRN